MLQVMRLTEYDPLVRPIADRHFSYRQPVTGPAHELDDALLQAAVVAIRNLVSQNAEAAKPILEQLTADSHDGAQWLLYEGLRAAGATYAEWAASLLLEDDHRLISGYVENSVWTTRQLLETITPQVSAETFAALEQAALALRPSWEAQAAPPGLGLIHSALWYGRGPLVRRGQT